LEEWETNWGGDQEILATVQRFNLPSKRSWWLLVMKGNTPEHGIRMVMEPVIIKRHTQNWAKFSHQMVVFLQILF